jgi:hypothetical protein
MEPLMAFVFDLAQYFGGLPVELLIVFMLGFGLGFFLYSLMEMAAWPADGDD